jgi:predicted amino acid racemase
MEEINAMNYPKLEINLRKLEHNARLEVQKLAKYGVTVMGVNKVLMLVWKFRNLPNTV